MIYLKKMILVFALSFAVRSSMGQTVEDIVAKNIEALGGTQKLASIRTIHMEGSMQTMGNDVKINITKSHLVGVRLDLSLAGKNGYQINTATQGWDYMPFIGQTAPEPWSAERVKNSLGNLDIQGIFFNYKTRGIQLELLGKDSVDTALCFKIKATNKTGMVTSYFVDTKTNLVVKTSTMKGFPGEETEVASFFSNFKKTADGFVFPFKTVTPTGIINYDKIEVNIPVDVKIFSPN